METRSTWVEVSRAALQGNYAAIAAHAEVPVCAVIKANGYGHGLVEAARAFSEAGVPLLGVTRVEEVRALRAAGIETPVLAMMPLSDQAEAARLGAELTVGSIEQAESVPEGATVHLKVDTGMGRLGVRPEDAEQTARAVLRRAQLRAVWTHFADAAGPSGAMQLARFRTVVTQLRHAGIDVQAHAANSAALATMPEARFDMVRVGTMLYGQDPAGARAPLPLAPTFAWRARVVAVRTLPAGSTVGYGSEWRAERETRVATLPVGYADGFAVEPVARTPSPKQALRGVARIAAATVRRAERVVHFDGRAAPVIGRVGMQAVTVSLQGLDDVGEGSVATLPARRLMVSAAIERVLT